MSTTVATFKEKSEGEVDEFAGSVHKLKECEDSSRSDETVGNQRAIRHFTPYSIRQPTKILYVDIGAVDLSGLEKHSADEEVSSEAKAFFNARSSIELPPPPPPPAPPPPDFLDDMNPDNPQHVNHPAIHEDVEFEHNVVQLAVPDPLPHQNPAPPPPDLLD